MRCLNTIDFLVSSLCRQQGIAHSIEQIPTRTDAANSAVQHLVGEERRIYRRIRSEKRKKAFLAGRKAAKQILTSPPFSMSVRDIEIGRSALGAPRITGCDHPYLSITHSDVYAIAVAAPFGVGVDLEDNAKRPQCLVDYFFSENEKRAIGRLMPIDRSPFINVLWTRKEAAVKVGGWGATIPFRSIDCTGPITRVNGRTIHLISRATSEFVASVAYDREVYDG
jgi:phosphopantetheinyl transferase